MLPGWLRNHGLPEMDVVEASTDPRVLAALDRAVARTNRAVSRAESIRSFRVLTTDFTEANGLLTPSLKVKRGKVMKVHADTIADIYASKKKGPRSRAPARRGEPPARAWALRRSRPGAPPHAPRPGRAMPLSAVGPRPDGWPRGGG